MKNKNISTVRGMHDIYGASFYKQKNILDNFIKVASLFNFTPMQTPIMEHSDVFLKNTRRLFRCCNEGNVFIFR